jgi:ABC-type multidrug transport system permease subunit
MGGLILKIIAITFATLLLLGVVINNVIFPINWILVIVIIAYSYYTVRTVIRNKNV